MPAKAKKVRTAKERDELKPERLAHLIATDLFLAGNGKRAKQLRLMESVAPDAKEYGGWGFDGLRSRVCQIIYQHFNLKPRNKRGST